MHLFILLFGILCFIVVTMLLSFYKANVIQFDYKNNVSLWLALLQSLYMAIVVYGPAIALEAGNLCSIL